MTPAAPFEHRTVLLSEAVEALAARPDGVYVDGTFGRGGHSRRLLQAPIGRLIAFDKDPEAVAAGQAIRDPRFEMVHDSYTAMQEVLAAHGVTQVDGILLDLGVSSPQLDDARRGFSFRHDGPLDMRMNPTQGITAATWLARVELDELIQVIREYGEEKFAVPIAQALIARRAEKRAAHIAAAPGNAAKNSAFERITPCESTRELAMLVARVVRTREPGQDPATRTFQALRIHLNRELAELPVVLNQALSLLRVGGRLVVISFHSLEDRLVKQFMQQQARPEAGTNVPRHLPLRADQLPLPRLRLLPKIRPSAAEVAANPRARSALMRVSEKLAEKLSVADGAS